MVRLFFSMGLSQLSWSYSPLPLRPRSHNRTKPPFFVRLASAFCFYAEGIETIFQNIIEKFPLLFADSNFQSTILNF